MGDAFAGAKEALYSGACCLLIIGLAAGAGVAIVATTLAGLATKNS